jgi:hypothetical protein
MRSVVVQDRADAAFLDQQRIAAVVEQVQVKRLVGLSLAIAVDHGLPAARRTLGLLADFAEASAGISKPESGT